MSKSPRQKSGKKKKRKVKIERKRQNREEDKKKTDRDERLVYLHNLERFTQSGSDV